MARRAKRVHERQAQEGEKACVLRCLRKTRFRKTAASIEYEGNGLRTRLATQP